MIYIKYIYHKPYDIYKKYSTFFIDYFYDVLGDIHKENMQESGMKKSQV